MLRNYFKIAWRNIKRHKIYSGINIIGLAIGIAACVLILQYVAFELSYENFHTNKNRIYRVEQDRFDNGKLSTQWAAGAFAAGNTFKAQIPEVEEYVKLVQSSQAVAEINHQPLKIDKVFFATGAFFKIFTYPVIGGDANKALTDVFSAAISQTTARTIFGTTNAVGKILKLNGKDNYTVTAVYKDPPVNTQL